MNWFELLKIIVPGLVGAGSAILSALLTNYYAEKRSTRESRLKEQDLRQRLVESFIPNRLKAYQEVFMLLQRLKAKRTIDTDTLDEFVPHLLWLEPAFSRELTNTLGETTANSAELRKKMSALQDKIRQLSGAEDLDALFINSNSSMVRQRES
jgi:hypothetical protein